MRNLQLFELNALKGKNDEEEYVDETQYWVYKGDHKDYLMGTVEFCFMLYGSKGC